MYNIAMSKEITAKEMLMFEKLDELKNINVEQEYKKIMVNPRSYFKKYLKHMDEKVITLAKFEIYFKMKTVDTREGSIKRAKSDAEYFMNKYTVSGYLDILSKFYTYALEIINDVINNGNDALLDLYNENKVSKETLEQSLKCLEKSKASLITDREAVTKAIEDTQKEIQKINDMLNNDFQGFSDTPF